MKRATKLGRYALRAIEMDGEGPPGIKTTAHDNSSHEISPAYERPSVETYKTLSDFTKAIEDLGVKGRVAQAHARGDAHDATTFDGKRIHIDPTNLTITYV